MSEKEYYGIDVSSWNGVLDWSKASGISFAILRITDLYGVDSSFESNYAGALSRGFKIGVYKYSYASTVDESKAEVMGVLSALKNRKLDFPVFLDLEWTKQASLGKAKLNEIIETFRTPIVEAGYKFAIYCNSNWYKNYIPDEAKKYDFWIASYPGNDTGVIEERLRPTGVQNIVGWQYSSKGKVEGFGSPFDMNVFYTDYSDTKEEEKEVKTVTVTEVLNKAKSWLGCNEADGSHKKIIDTYNSHKPWARSYKVKYTDQWCDTFVSAVFIALDAIDTIGGTECGVEEHVKLFKKAGIWNEDGSITPKAGDIIVFNWDTSKQPNDGYADHIGFVETVSNGTITTIEGNYKDSVARRTLKVGNGNIRGYARPKYKVETAKKEEPVPAPTPTPAPVAEKKALSIVQRGSSGNDVKLLQRCLEALGFGITADGSYGMKTYAAVTAFQNSHGLSVDGVVGEKTWAALIKALVYRKSEIDGLLLTLQK